MPLRMTCPALGDQARRHQSGAEGWQDRGSSPRGRFPSPRAASHGELLVILMVMVIGCLTDAYRMFFFFLGWLHMIT